MCLRMFLRLLIVKICKIKFDLNIRLIEIRELATNLSHARKLEQKIKCIRELDLNFITCNS